MVPGVTWREFLTSSLYIQNKSYPIIFLHPSIYLLSLAIFGANENLATNTPSSPPISSLHYPHGATPLPERCSDVTSCFRQHKIADDETLLEAMRHCHGEALASLRRLFWRVLISFKVTFFCVPDDHQIYNLVKSVCWKKLSFKSSKIASGTRSWQRQLLTLQGCVVSPLLSFLCFQGSTCINRLYVNI